MLRQPTPWLQTCGLAVSGTSSAWVKTCTLSAPGHERRRPGGGRRRPRHSLLARYDGQAGHHQQRDERVRTAVLPRRRALAELVAKTERLKTTSHNTLNQSVELRGRAT